MLAVENIVKSYRNHHDEVIALQDINITIQKGELISIIGPSGCGKSTLIEIIAGLQSPTSGQILFDNKKISNKRGIVSYMPQGDVLFPWRTILENVILPLELQGIAKEASIEKAKQYLPLFGLHGLEHHLPFMLSGGMRQRANFLKTFLYGKEMLVLDEPFGKLDAITRLQMQLWLMDLCVKTNQTVLLITHVIEEAIFLSDRIYVYLLDQ